MFGAIGTITVLCLAFGLVAYFAIKYIREVAKVRTIEQEHRIDIREQRTDAVKRSRSVIEGQVAEQLVPHFPEWKYVPSEARFLASPLDYVVFEGLSKDEVDSIKFVEVKTGKGKPNKRQISTRKAIEDGRVGYELLEVDMNGKPVKQDEIDLWIDRASVGKTIDEVSLEFGRSTATIYKYVPKGVFNSSGGLRNGKKVILSDIDSAYLAGIIDGEGSIGLSKLNRKGRTFISPVITITNTSKNLVDKVSSIYPNGTWRTRQRSYKNKPINEWVLNKTNNVADLLQQIIPHLSAKLDKANLVLDFCKYRQEKKPYSEIDLEFFNKLEEIKNEK